MLYSILYNLNWTYCGTVGITAHLYDEMIWLMMLICMKQDMHRSESQAYTVLLQCFKYCIFIRCVFL